VDWLIDTRITIRAVTVRPLLDRGEAHRSRIAPIDGGPRRAIEDGDKAGLLAVERVLSESRARSFRARAQAMIAPPCVILREGSFY
jgi:hypothetical protein